ncbi:MAG: hypothetical protein ACXADY_15790, partial [Candidatus Hodarchaeales archaeon]
DHEEWERISDLGDSNSQLEKESDEEWEIFFRDTIQQGLIDKEILALINEGKMRIKKMRKEL